MPPTTPLGRRPYISARFLRLVATGLLGLAVVTCSDEHLNGPSGGSRGYFAFRPVTHLSSPAASFGIVVDSVHIVLTRPPSTIVLDTTAAFPADSTDLHLSLLVPLQQQAETLLALVELKAGPSVVFSGTQNVVVVNGPPGSSPPPSISLAFVGPGRSLAHITLAPRDTAVLLGDSVNYTATGVDSSNNPVSPFYVGWRTSDTTLAKVNANGLLRAPNHRGTLKVIGVTPTGIADTTHVTFVPTATALVKVSGDLQTDTVAHLVPAPIVVQAKAADNLGVTGVSVHFSALSGGSVTDSIVLTDSLGHASTPVTLGTIAGPQKFVARVGTLAPDTFTVTAVAGVPSAIAISGGNAQTDTTDLALAQPFATRVTDAFGNAVTGAKVAWLRVAGGGTLATDTTITDTTGTAKVGYTLGALARTDTVTATLAGTTAKVTFTATAIAAAASNVAVASGNAQTDTVGKALPLPLVVYVTDARAHLVAGARVIWSAAHGGGTFSPDTVFTDTTGHAQATYTVGTLAGTDSLVATGQCGCTATFTATALPGAPAAIAIQGGNAQTDTINTALPLPLSVKATDAFGNAVTGATVNWTRLAGGGTLSAPSTVTAATGLTQVTYTLGSTPRVDSIKATLGAGPAAVTFTATTIPPAPTGIAILSGNAQTDTVTRTLTQPLAVTVTGSGGKPVAGTKVAFSIKTGSGTFGALAVDTITTDTLGHAQVPFTFSPTAGTDSVLARTVVGGFTATFVETAIPAAPTVIGVQSGNAQVDTIGLALPLPLAAKVTDSHANPVAGVKVFWTRVSGGGVIGSDSAFTNTLGVAQTAYTLGGTPSVDSVHATIAGTGTFALFTATAVAPAPTAIAIVSGNAQTDTVTRALAQPLVVTVTGAGSKPVAGTRVAFSVKTGTGTFGALAVDTITTDTLGHAQVPFTLGAVAGSDSVLAKTVVGGFTVTFAEIAIPGAPSAIAIVSGNAQSDTAKGTLPLPLIVKVTDAQNNPVNAAKVIWTVPTGTGTFGGLAVDTVATAANGQASVNFTLGASAGTDTLRATIQGTAAFVNFTATGTSGAASAISIVSGNPQTDTVGVVLPAPLVVRLADGSNNPVANAKVYWTRTFGTGTVSADSNVTNALGQAQINFTLATTAGTDSIKAALSGGTSVMFAATGTPGAPATIAATGGNNQSGTTGTVLPNPLTVKVSDAHANPVPGLTVTWAVTAGGGTLGGVTATTDATGTSTVAQWTLGGTAGTNTATATLAGVSGSPVTFTAVSLPLGTTKTWTGTAGTAWATAGSWNPTGVPLSTDNVYIPSSAPAPSLTANASVGGLSVETGATLSLGAGDTLTTLGTILVPSGATVTGSGAIASTGTSQQVSGALSNLAVTGSTVLAGPTSVSGGVAISGSGTLTVNGKSLGVAGGVTLSGSGQLVMTNAADSVDVTGAYSAGGGSTGSNLSAGVLVLRGDLTQVSNFSNDFAPTGTHVTRFAGSALQTITFANPAAASSHFQNVQFANAAGVTFASDVVAAGSATITAGTVTGTGRMATIGGGLTDATSSRWHVDTTTFSGGGALALPDSMTGVVAFAGAGTSLSKAFKLNGTALVVGSATLAPAGQALTVTGSLAVSQSAELLMTNAADSVDVGGLFVTSSITSSSGGLTAGKLVLRGSFTQTSGSGLNFAASGTHRTIFAGGAAQAAVFASPGATSSHFQDVTFADPAGVAFGSNATISGTATVSAGQVTGPIRVLTIGTGLVDAGFGWHADTTIFTGSSAVFPDSLTGSVHLQGADTLTHSFKALGQLAVDGAGALTVNGHVLTADSSLTIASSGLLRMTNAADSVDVRGGFSVSSITASSGAMTAGTLVLRGGFAQVSGSGLDFSASGSHRTVFAGTAAQVASFQSPGLTSSHFQDVVFDNAAGVTLSSPMSVTGSATILAGNVTGTTGNIATIAGNLVDASNSRWHVDTTYFTGSPVLPDSFSGSVHFQGATTLAKALKVLGAVAVDGGGVFTLGGHPFTVTGAFNLAGSGQLVMSNAADSMDVGGPFSVSSLTASGTGLSAGVLVLRGNFSQVSGSGLNFSATGSHRTVLAGAAAQTVTFQSPALTSSHFQDVTFTNAAGITLGSNVAVSGTATVALGQVLGIARTGTIAGGLVDAGFGWRADTTIFTGHPALPDSVFGNVHIQGADTLAKAFRATGTLAVDQSGVLVVNGHPLSVAGAMTVANSGRFLMTNPADSVNVGGTYTAGGASSTGDLTAGKLVLRGNFAQLANASGDFAPSGTHLTVFAGTAAQSVTFANPGAAQSHFQDVTFDNAAGVALGSNAVAVGTATALAGNVTGVARVATIGTALVDASSIRWQVDTTVFSGTPASLPDSIHSNVHFQGALTLAKALRIVGGAYVDGGANTLTVGGHPLVVTGALQLASGGQLAMLNPADSVDVGGMRVATATSGAGLDTTGVLVMRGGFHQTGGSAAGFAASGSHRTRLVTGSVDSVSFNNPGLSSGSHFGNVEVTAGAGTIVLGSDVEAAGVIVKASGAAPTLRGIGSLLLANGLNVDGLVLDSLRLVKAGAVQVVRFDSVTFQHMDPTGTQFALNEAGAAGQQVFTGVRFTTVPTTGKYLQVADSVANGSPVTIGMDHSLPLNGSAATAVVNGNDGAVVNWSTLVFAPGPQNDTTGVIMTPAIRAVAVGPVGDTLTTFTDTVTVAIGTNPVGGTLTGTLKRAAVAGVATFNDLVITGVGNGYTLTAATPQLPTITSAPFNIGIFVPAGTSAIWSGTTDSIWTTAANWQGGVVPDSTSNVLIPAGTAHAPVVQLGGTARTNRLTLQSGATLAIDSMANLYADSTVSNAGTVTGMGTLELKGAGTVSGSLSGVRVTGNYAVDPTGAFTASGNLTILGAAARFDLGGRHGSVGGTLLVTSSGLLVMQAAGDTLAVTGPAQFSSGNEAGLLTNGLLQLAGNFTEGFGDPHAFAASGAHLTRFTGAGGTHTVHFGDADTAKSHFANVEFAGTDSVSVDTITYALGNVSITGATTAVSVVDTLAATGNVTTATGSRLWAAGLALGGALTANGSYHVGSTGFIGAGQTVPALPYVNVRVTGSAVLGANVTADSLTVGGAATPGQLDLNGRHLTLTGSALVDTSGTLLMTTAADTFMVGGNLTVQGHDSTGKLTAGLIDIAGNFAQPSGSAAFLPSGSHTVRFNGGSHLVVFSTTGALLIGYVPSAFNQLDVTGGATVDVRSNAEVTGNLTVTGSTLVDTTHSLVGDILQSSAVQVNGNVTADATSTLQLLVLGVNGVLSAPNVSAQYNVGKTTFGGAGQSVPVLPYQAVEVDGTATASAALAMSTLTIGTSSIPGAVFDPAGFPITMSGQLTVAPGGLLQMTNAADSVDVGGYVSFAGANSNGHLTAGVLVLRAGFVQNAGGNDSAFFATGAHRTVFIGGSGSILGIGYAGTHFNRLAIRDTISLQSGTLPLIVGDTLHIQGSLADAGFGHIEALGALVVDSAASLSADTLDVHTTFAMHPSATFTLPRVRYAGTGQVIPQFSLPYQNLDVMGTASLGTSVAAFDTVTVTGTLTLGGHTLVADSAFSTAGTGTIVMTNALDSVITQGTATFGGGSTAGLLTAGVVQAPYFQQLSSNSPLSFAASGSHRLNIVDNSLFAGGPVTFQSSSAAASHPQNLSFVIASQRTLSGNIYVGDTLTPPPSDGTVNGTGTTMTVAGPVVQSGSVKMSVDTLVLLFANNPIQGASTPTFWTPVVTRFAGINQAIRDTVSYNAVEVTGSAHVTFHANATSVVVNGGNLTVGPGNFGSSGDFTTTNGGILTMTDPAAILFVNGNATFGGGSTASSLTAGQIQVGGSFSELATSSVTDFSPLGTKVVLNGGAQQTVSFASPVQSYFRDLDVFNTGGVFAKGRMLVTSNFTTNQPVNGDTLSVFGTLTDTNTIAPPPVSLRALMLAGPLTTSAGTAYNVTRTHFLATNAVPALTYTDLVINAPVSFVTPGAKVTSLYVAGPGAPLYQGTASSASLTLSPGLLLTATGKVDVQQGDLTLGGAHLVADSGLNVGTGGTLTMTNAADSLEVVQGAVFGGNSTAGLLTAGTLILDGDFTQTGNPQAFAPSGSHLTVFNPASRSGGVLHAISFSNPTTSAFQDLREDYPDTLAIFNGEADVVGTFTVTHAIFQNGLLIRSGLGNGLLKFGTADVHAAVFDSVTAQYMGGSALVAFDSVTFNAPTSGFTQFVAAAQAGDTVRITNPVFTNISAASGNGDYVSATNTSGTTPNLVVQVISSNLTSLELAAHDVFDAFSEVDWL